MSAMKKIVAVALATLLAGTMAACSSSNRQATSQSGLQKVRVGLMPYQDYLTIVAFGDEMGWFKEEGIDLEYRVLDWYDKANEALASNSVDIASSTLDSRIGPAETFSGAKQFMLGYSYEGFGLLTRSGSGIKTFEDYVAQGLTKEQAVVEVAKQLKGKTVIFPASGSSLILVEATLAAANLTINDIKVVDMNVDSGLSAFLGGNGDFYLGGTPQRVKAIKEGNKTLVDATNLPASAVELAGFAATDGFIKDHPDLLVKFIKVWYRGIMYVKDNPADGYKRIADLVNKIHGTQFLTVKDMEGIWNKVEYFPESPCAAQKFFYDKGAPRHWKQSFDVINKVYLGSKVLKSDVSPDTVLALDRFQQMALKDANC